MFVCLKVKFLFLYNFLNTDNVINLGGLNKVMLRAFAGWTLVLSQLMALLCVAMHFNLTPSLSFDIVLSSLNYLTHIFVNNKLLDYMLFLRPLFFLLVLFFILIKLLNYLENLTIRYYSQFVFISYLLNLVFMTLWLVLFISSFCMEVVFCDGTLPDKGISGASPSENISLDGLKGVKKNKPFIWAQPGEVPEYPPKVLRLYKALATMHVYNYKGHSIDLTELVRLLEEIKAVKSPDVSHITAPVDASRFNEGHYRWNLLSDMEKWRLNKDLAHKAYVDSLAASASLVGDNTLSATDVSQLEQALGEALEENVVYQKLGLSLDEYQAAMNTSIENSTENNIEKKKTTVNSTRRWSLIRKVYHAHEEVLVYKELGLSVEEYQGYINNLDNTTIFNNIIENKPLNLNNKTKFLITVMLCFVIVVIAVIPVIAGIRVVLYYTVLLYYAVLKKRSNNKNRTY
jgi:hypothetical protein